jgi:hypothetical protein
MFDDSMQKKLLFHAFQVKFKLYINSVIALVTLKLSIGSNKLLKVYMKQFILSIGYRKNFKVKPKFDCHSHSKKFQWQIEDEAVQKEDEQLRAVAHMRCPETLLPSLVQASQRQGLGDTARPPAQCTPREGPARSSSLVTQHSEWWKKAKKLRVCHLNAFSPLI